MRSSNARRIPPKPQPIPTDDVPAAVQVAQSMSEVLPNRYAVGASPHIDHINALVARIEFQGQTSKIRSTSKDGRSNGIKPRPALRKKVQTGQKITGV